MNRSESFPTINVSNFDTTRPDNDLHMNGKTALDGLGSSIAQITP